MKTAVIYLIKGYQLLLSPFWRGCCRFNPTCSAYAVEAVRKFGAVRGLWLAMGRICRCHPLGGAGYDPPPDPTKRGRR